VAGGPVPAEGAVGEGAEVAEAEVEVAEAEVAEAARRRAKEGWTGKAAALQRSRSVPGRGSR
jgi:hypothetical protein